MADQETTVESLFTESAAVDAQQAQGESLSAIVEEAAQEQQEQTEGRKEPGYVKGRINAAVQRAIAETEARITAKYDAMLKPLWDSVLEREAQQLVDSGEVKSLDMAKEYLRLKGGMPASAPAPQQQNRDDQGRFTPQEKTTGDDPIAHAKADLLAKQAQKIKASRGVDVMQAFNDNPEIKQKVLSGEWDFYDVLESMSSEESRPTPAVRSPNGSTPQGLSIATMSDAEWNRLQAGLASGRVFNVRN